MYALKGLIELKNLFNPNCKLALHCRGYLRVISEVVLGKLEIEIKDNILG